MALILLRHAPPPHEYHRCYLGHTDVGIDATLFDEAKIAPLLSERFDRIYSSDLLRCTQTLEAIGLRGYTADPRLREVRFRTSFEGKTFEQVERMREYDPAVLDSAEAWHDFVCDESSEAFRRRIGWNDQNPPLPAQSARTSSCSGLFGLCSHPPFWVQLR
ncbi:MAG: hypothetical protein JU82_10070 [Sulfuricurvum sp. MLSB]|uniref:histidine phosphatase family protein n=1 Tax=Sulfuricurvum sp. MLSB TaxID=1537917 RepID=UPI00050277AD|nr:histidine phosphatase family protein [Sulfuricurvum sp. MLSB]KFN38786.1 MAG: hypothetical protein JU82_10070 [Sulfuricurvum sp. MLSB]